MSENVIVAECYTEREALSLCHAMDGAGVDVIYQPPPLTGNYMTDWNLGAAESIYVLRVPQEQVEEALDVLEKVDLVLNEDGGEGESQDQPLESVEPMVVSEDFSDEIVVERDAGSSETRRALNTAIISWLVFPLWPYAVWRLAVALNDSSTSVDRRRLFFASILILLNPLPFIFFLFNSAG